VIIVKISKAYYFNWQKFILLLNFIHFLCLPKENEPSSFRLKAPAVAERKGPFSKAFFNISFGKSKTVLFIPEENQRFYRGKL